MRRTITAVFAVIALVVLAVIARYRLAGHQVPAGQTPLAELTIESLGSLKADFNRSADGLRIVLLLSPT
jgi:hypothetical protein